MATRKKHLCRFRQRKRIRQVWPITQFFTQICCCNIINLLSVILYFCSCFWKSESRLLRRLFQPLHLCVPLLLLLNRKVFTSSFFWYVPSPWSWSRKCKRTFKAINTKIYENRMIFFKRFIKIRETAVPIRNWIFLWTWKVSWKKWLPEQRLVDL